MAGPQAGDRRRDAALHLGKRLAAREPEPAGASLYAAPLGQRAQRLELSARPFTEVTFDEPTLDGHLETQPPGDRLRRLLRPLEWGGVHGLDLGRAGQLCGHLVGVGPPAVG